MRSKEMSEKIAKKMAEMHRIKVLLILLLFLYILIISPPLTTRWNISNITTAGLRVSSSIVCLPVFCSRYPVEDHGNMKTIRLDLLKEEIDDLVSRFLAEDYEVVFGHHDLQHGNVLQNKEGTIMFVDFEYVLHFQPKHVLSCRHL